LNLFCKYLSIFLQYVKMIKDFQLILVSRKAHFIPIINELDVLEKQALFDITWLPYAYTWFLVPRRIRAQS